MIFFYALFSVISIGVWMLTQSTKRVVDAHSIYASKEDILEYTRSKKTTKTGTIFFGVLFMIYNFFALPWIAIELGYKLSCKILFQGDDK